MILERFTAPPSLSYELFPPATTAASEAVHDCINELESTEPDYVSVTYAGTADRRKASVELIEHLINNTRLRPLAHLTCVGESRESLESLLQHFVSIGVRGVLALRGDLPADPGAERGELPFARYLVELIRDIEFRHTAALGAGRLAIGVAAYPVRHPESPSFDHDVEVLLAKERSGANFAITQVYFDPLDYTGLCVAASKAGVRIPLVPGIMALSSINRLNRLAAMTGVVPDPVLAHALETARDESERHAIGVAAAVKLARRALDDGAPGIHLYTFNDHRGVLDIVDQLALPTARTRAAEQFALLASA